MNSIVLTVVMVLASAAVVLAQTNQQSETGTPNKTFDPHDLSGVWSHPGATHSDKVPPMTAEGQAKFAANKPSFGPREVPPVFGNDPIGKCDPQGFPRTNTFENPQTMEIIQVPGRVLQFIEWNHVSRAIWADGRAIPKHPLPTWYGYSVGKWEGDTFVVDTVGLDERTWLDRFGDPHSSDLHVQERYRRLDHDTLEFNMIIDDTKTYTQSWAIVKDKKLKLDPSYELEEDVCAPSVEEDFNKNIRNPAGSVTTPK
jgi:hypothetical protein